MKEEPVADLTKPPDRHLYLHCNRASGASAMACETKELESRDSEVGHLHCRGILNLREYFVELWS